MVDFSNDVSVGVIGCDTGTTLMKNANNKEKCVCMRVCVAGEEIRGTFLCFPPNVSINLKMQLVEVQ